VIVQPELEVQRALHVIYARIRSVLGVHFTVEQPVGVHGRNHVRATTVDLHVEARRHLVSGGTGNRQVRTVVLLLLRQAGHTVVRDAAHVHACLIVIERTALELLGRQAYLLASVRGGHVLVDSIHRP